MSRRAALLGVLLALVPATRAAAFFAPGAAVVSASPQRGELADDGSQLSALSADGRFAVFQTRATNLFADDDADPEGSDRLGGIFRRELGSDSLVTVASGDEVDEADGTLRRLGARNPSVSADGRYVAFSTAYGLVPSDTNDAVDVYVRDLSVRAADAGAYTLVSARDGSDAGATYAASSDPKGVRAGSEVWPLTSISADGRKVVFRTNVASDLPLAAQPDVPAGQLFVRDLDARTTRLITRSRTDASPAGGAFGPVALSADGAALVWTGANARAQAPFLDGEPYTDTDAFYLWQRLADGPSAPTRRITGTVDFDDPGCSPQTTVTASPTATGPCYGALASPEQGTASISSRPLAISGDGWRVWFVTSGFPRPTGLTSGVLDVFATDLHQGVSRKGGTVELTREGAADDSVTSSSVDGLAVTPDGRWLALATTRTRFVGGRLSLTGPSRAVADTRELYLSDLSTGGTERVVTAFSGADADGGSVNPQVSLSADGQRIGFTSGASNLFFGDANARPDAFVVTRQEPPATEDPLPPENVANDDVVAPTEPDEPSLRVRVSRAANHAVVLRVTVPAAGRLTVQARGRVPGAGGKRTKLRTFAKAAATAKAPRTLRVTLVAGKAFRRPLKRFRRLNASARIAFAPAVAGSRIVVARKVRFLPLRTKRAK